MEEKKTAKKSLYKKIVAMLLAVVLIVGATIAGTMAWLTATTGAVTNTFVVGNIGTLTLKETPVGTGTETDNAYIIIPGDDIEKDPVVNYSPTNEDGVEKVPVYVFVKVGVDSRTWTISGSDTDGYTYTFTPYTGSTQSKGTIAWSVASGWKQVSDNANVYYKELDKTASLSNDPIIKDNKITVSNAIISSEMASIDNAINSITFTAYAIQQEDGGTENDGKFTPAEAWAAVTSNS